MSPLQIVTEPLALSSEEAFARLSGRPYTAFLDSALVDAATGRYSVIACDPLRVLSTAAAWNTVMNSWQAREVRSASLDEDLAQWPFKGGWIGYMAYEYYQELIPQVSSRATKYPLLHMAFYDSFLLFDHQQQTAFVASLGLEQVNGESDPVLARQRITRLQEALAAGPVAPFVAMDMLPLQASTEPHRYFQDVRRIQEYISAGDCYQVNYTQRFVGFTSQSADTLYRSLRRCSPAPMAAYLDIQSFQILSASPESLLAIRGDQVQTRPIKGTRPRGRSAQEDAQLKDKLWRSEKDRAELLMITDLERNDLGRVCVPGTIKTESLLSLQSLEQLHHLYSLVVGRLPADTIPWTVLTACFPGGSITGAPKIRAMQIIRELETHAREVYTGAIGSVSLDGHSHWNIPIRTLIYDHGNLMAYAGGGIVADSDPEAEYEECLIKLSGLHATLDDSSFLAKAQAE